MTHRRHGTRSAAVALFALVAVAANAQNAPTPIAQECTPGAPNSCVLPSSLCADCAPPLRVAAAPIPPSPIGQEFEYETQPRRRIGVVRRAPLRSLFRRCRRR